MNTMALIAPVIMFSIVLVIAGVLRHHAGKKKVEANRVAPRELTDPQQANRGTIPLFGAQAGSYVTPEQKRYVQ